MKGAFYRLGDRLEFFPIVAEGSGKTVMMAAKIKAELLNAIQRQAIKKTFGCLMPALSDHVQLGKNTIDRTYYKPYWYANYQNYYRETRGIYPVTGRGDNNDSKD